jgi:hypothetical protein
LSSGDLTVHANFFQAGDMNVGTENNEKNCDKKATFYPEKPRTGSPGSPF